MEAPGHVPSVPSPKSGTAWQMMKVIKMPLDPYHANHVVPH